MYQQGSKNKIFSIDHYGGIFLKRTPVHTKSSVRFLEISHRTNTLTTMRIRPAFYGYYITLYNITL